ncbi:unnamed protein product [Dibothriocephalus latus]|uniref:Uncharacterized protein n=1 Tax=Dibothriocephalus latus TaxID=60516 RepID=A0A3P7NBX2_DIBLA|nr:unnamed protein product [Dibothriocephalus latus]
MTVSAHHNLPTEKFAPSPLFPLWAFASWTITNHSYFTPNIHTADLRRCCGGSNYRVYEISKWASGESEITAKTGIVPESCCARYNSGEFVNVTVCQSAVDLTEIPDAVYTEVSP